MSTPKNDITVLKHVVGYDFMRLYWIKVAILNCSNIASHYD
jgi:hypothetical protein